MSEPSLPPSVADFRVSLVGLVAMLLATFTVMAQPSLTLEFVAPFVLVATAVPMVAANVLLGRVHRNPSTGIDWDKPWSLDVERVATKWLAGTAIVGVILAVYWLAPEYDEASYLPFYGLLTTWGPPAAGFSLLYMAWVDGKLREPEDAYWSLGLALRGRWRGMDVSEVANLARSWAVKAFFIPLMYGFLANSLNHLVTLLASTDEPARFWFDGITGVSGLVDVVFGVIGYLLSLRLLDTHIRTAEPTLLGWSAALACYPPFYAVVGGSYLAYQTPLGWWEWLAPFPTLRVAWGVVVAAALVVFAWATMSFGCRFSNLTHRGVITSGPYRYTKHPAYISKLVSFLMISVPFVYSGSIYQTVSNCVMLLGVAGLYAVRAKTEEWHLSRDPDYVRYALWINDHGLFAPLGRWWPSLRYRPPESDRSS